MYKPRPTFSSEDKYSTALIASTLDEGAPIDVNALFFANPSHDAAVRTPAIVVGRFPIWN